MTERIKWLPLASDPVAFNSFADDVSWPTDAWHFVDVWGLDEELLAFVPSPVKAVLLLFPTGEAMNKLRKSEEATDGSILPTGPEDAILWIPQTIGNACGTMGLLHAFANAGVDLPSESSIAKFVDQLKPLAPAQRTALLGQSQLLETAHTAAVTAGATLMREADHDTNLHFVCFVHAKGRDGQTHLVELDGGRSGPLDRGISSNLLDDTAKVVKEVYMRVDGSENYSLMALAPNVEA